MNALRVTLPGLFWAALLAAVSHAATHTAASPSYNDVTAAINAADSGDTVIVPAGTTTWDRNLQITKGIVLKGAGPDKTRILNNYEAARPGNTTAEGNFLVVYKPANPSLNEPFRLTGFSFDMNRKCGGLLLSNPTVTPINKIRIDHNQFKNAGHPKGTMRTVLVSGTVYGVIDNNTFTGHGITSYGCNAASWNKLTFTFGTGENIYYEDNVFHLAGNAHDSGVGGRWCARFNAYKAAKESGGLHPWLDAHGNQAGGNHAIMGVEIYRNVLTLMSQGVCIFDQRGGKAVVFDNNVITSGGVYTKVREEFNDDKNPPAVSSVSGQPQHVSDSYYWHNTKNDNILVHTYVPEPVKNPGPRTRPSQIDYGPPRGLVPQENREFFNQNPKFDGTKGVGVGLLADRPKTCAPGVAYWATNEGDWNKSDRGGQGVLYKCTTPNTWTLYYTPYTYPHPLRVSGPLADILPPPSTPAKPSTGPTAP